MHTITARGAKTSAAPETTTLAISAVRPPAKEFVSPAGEEITVKNVSTYT